jgi:HD-GYP domain-containing protein (c-di-GMP phosphodiesterase class II)
VTGVQTCALPIYIYLAPPVLESLDYFKEKDFYTYRHMLLVFALSILLSRELNKDNRKLLQGAAASPSHDFGKICVPLDVLKKTKPLTLEERKLLEHHTLAGYVLLKYYLAGGENDDMAARIARDHHERKNGSGYPGGIRLDDPILEIVVVSDLYDALTSPRPYRLTPYKNRTALEEICNMANRGELNWEVVNALVACNRREKTDHNSCLISREKRGVPPSDNVYGITESKK